MDPISAREREVLQALAADGATNAEIAGRLFISVRTVESHVASLLRKSGVHDRRALLRLAPDLLGTSTSDRTSFAPLTSFLGREREQAQVVAALATSRLVTVVGSGGSGKTRLALHVLDEVAVGYPDHPVGVDLVPVSDAALVPSAIAQRLGLAERGSAESAIAARFRSRRGLVLLDNCEHLAVALAGVLERLLANCPGLTVLATSRTRFAVPFETVLRLGGLEVETAVDLFAQRAASGGEALNADDRRRAEVVCRALERLPLAIELAAAQVSAIGLDGVEAALTDPLALLSGGSRADARHESVRATLEWSHDLLGPIERAVLRRLAVLTVPFPVEVAKAVSADWSPVPASVGRLLGALVDASLLAMERGPNGTRYRLHEMVRRFASERGSEADEAAESESRLLAWCRARVATLEAGPDDAQDDELALARSAVESAAARRPAPDALVAGLARRLAALLFATGAPADAQRMFEVAAMKATAPVDAAEDLALAAGAAETHAAGAASVALRRASAAQWDAAGAPAMAAVQLARAAEVLNRAPGYFDESPDEGVAEGLIAAARRLAGEDLQAAGRILTATAFAGLSEVDGSVTQEAIALARRVGDLAGESAALDADSSRELVDGHVARAYALNLRRISLLEPVRSVATTGFEFEDAMQTAGSCALALGDMQTALRLALEVEKLPGLAAERHIAVALLMLVETMRGDLVSAVGRAPTFLASWNRMGRPAIGAVSSGAYAAATAFALRGDDDSAGEWRTIADELFGPRTRMIDFERATYDLLVLLHRGDWAGALQRARSHPGTQGSVPVAQWIAAYWRPWYTALWAEAAVLAGAPDAADRLALAPRHLSGNPVAAAIVDRAAALLAHDSAAMVGIAERLDELDAPYQAARTRVLAGESAAARGAAETAACGAAPMTSAAWFSRT